MPAYEYACSACGHRFEEFQSIKAAPIKKCPKCKKNKVQRLISSGAGFIFKGSGFYITDYRSEKYKNDAKADAPKTETAPKDSTAKSDTPASTPAPAPATESKPAAEKPPSKSKPPSKK